MFITCHYTCLHTRCTPHTRLLPLHHRTFTACHTLPLPLPLPPRPAFATATLPAHTRCLSARTRDFMLRSKALACPLAQAHASLPGSIPRVAACIGRLQTHIARGSRRRRRAGDHRCVAT